MQYPWNEANFNSAARARQQRTISIHDTWDVDSLLGPEASLGQDPRGMDERLRSLGQRKEPCDLEHKHMLSEAADSRNFEFVAAVYWSGRMPGAFLKGAASQAKNLYGFCKLLGRMKVDCDWDYLV